MTPAKIYNFQVAANATYQLPVAGDYFVILSETGDVEVTVNTFGTLGTLAAGQGLEETPFTRLDFRDLTGAANQIKVLVAGEKFINQRVVGEVSVIDGGKARTLANAGFMGSTYCNAVAAAYSHCQLWNPATNTKRAVISAITLGSPAGAAYVLRGWNAAIGAGPSNPPSKLIGGAQSVMEARNVTNAALIPTTVNLGQGYVQASQNTPIVLKEPIVLVPGQGVIAVISNNQNQDLSAAFDFVEELNQ